MMKWLQVLSMQYETCLQYFVNKLEMKFQKPNRSLRDNFKIYVGGRGWKLGFKLFKKQCGFLTS